MPPFSLVFAPADLADPPSSLNNALLPLAQVQVPSFGAVLEPRYIIRARALDQ